MNRTRITLIGALLVAMSVAPANADLDPPVGGTALASEVVECVFADEGMEPMAPQSGGKTPDNCDVRVCTLECVTFCRNDAGALATSAEASNRMGTCLPKCAEDGTIVGAYYSCVPKCESAITPMSLSPGTGCWRVPPIDPCVECIVPPIVIRAKTCPSTPATGWVSLAVTIANNEVLLRHEEGFGQIQRTEEIGQVGLAGLTLGLDMEGPAGLGTLVGTPFVVAGSASAQCGKATADFELGPIRIKAGSLVTCKGDARGTWLGTGIGVVSGVGLTWLADADSAVPCRT